jgi:hypothetical protein
MGRGDLSHPPAPILFGSCRRPPVLLSEGDQVRFAKPEQPANSEIGWSAAFPNQAAKPTRGYAEKVSSSLEVVSRSVKICLKGIRHGQSNHGFARTSMPTKSTQDLIAQHFSD